MNKVILMGRLTRDPDVRYANTDGSMAIARYSIAVDRRGARTDDQQTADFINIVAFGKGGEFAEKYLHKGTKVLVTGRIQTGSYTNKDGVKVYTTDIVAEDQEFAESKNASGQIASPGGADYKPNFGSPASNQRASKPKDNPPPFEGFMNFPDPINGEDELPFGPVTR